MFATRLLRPVFQTATRSLTTTLRPRTYFTSRIPQPPSSRLANSQNTTKWRTTFRHAQQTRSYRRPYNYQRYQQTAGLLRRWAARPTFYYEVGGIGAVCGGYYIYNLEEVPGSGRRRFNVISPEFEKEQGQGMYEQTMQEFGRKLLPEYSKEHRQVQRVLQRLVPHSGLEGSEWEVHVIDDDMANAFVIPGGKVFVFRGILDIAGNDDGLAAVLGHEIAHNVAHHAAERLSQFAILLPLGLLAYLAAGVDPQIFQFVTNLAFSLPGSRKQEAEADYLGLMMMAESCYDPRAAVKLWAKMEEKEKGQAPPQFMSTHPSSHNRMEKIQAWLPKADVRRENSDCSATIGFSDEFHKALDYTKGWRGNDSGNHL